MSDFLGNFSAALAAHGMTCPADVRTDGALHRFRSQGDGDANSWYVLHDGGSIVVGAFGCWKRQVTAKYCSKDRAQMSRDEWNVSARLVKEADAARKKAEEKLQEEARKTCAVLFSTCPAAKSHAYLSAKRVMAHGNLRISDLEATNGWLAIPLQDELGVIHSAQFISEDGAKRFCYGGRVAGCYFKLAEHPATPLLICEGYATGATLHEATNWSVVCAMNCGNLKAVSVAMRKAYPGRIIIIAGDNDQFTDGNPGEAKGKEAAEAISAIFSRPEFSDESLESKPTDFNDLANIHNLLEVRRQVVEAVPIHGTPIGELKLPEKDDPSELLKFRYLCKKGGILVSGPTGMGKSSALMQALALWSNGMDFFDIKPTRPLTAILVQAENDDGDLAEMRDGICKGLNFSDFQRRNFFSRILVFSSNGLTRQRLCDEVLSPLLALHRPDILAIDPVLAFLGGESNNQRDVGDFLRGMINPLLFRYDCAAILMHHTNKPSSGKEKPEWKNGEMAYLGSGSAEWANWARAVLSLQSSGTPGIYKLHAAKRGARLGWRDDGDELTYEKVIAWSKEKDVICWHETNENEIKDGGGRPKSYTDKELVDLLGSDGLTFSEWEKSAREYSGVKSSTFYRAVKDLEATEKIIKSAIDKKWKPILGSN